ncbi:MAG: NADH-quinone oxidoreductase subunit NuoE [Chloroflexi bacterium]|nr:NADH-quinone oxidoreductase subunit NuoE [Chloroflexota bacterium]
MKQELSDILRKYEGKRDDLIPIMQEVQEKFGYLPEEEMKEVAKFLRLPESEVFGVETFYAQFKLKPSGKTCVTVCRGTACHVKGGARILKEVEKALGVPPGETTPDLQYTLETVACIGACAVAPNLIVGKETHGKMTVKKVGELFPSPKK